MADNNWEFTYDVVFGNDLTQDGLIPGTFIGLNIVSHLDDEIIFIFSNKDQRIGLLFF